MTMQERMINGGNNDDDLEKFLTFFAPHSQQEAISCISFFKGYIHSCWIPANSGGMHVVCNGYVAGHNSVVTLISHKASD